MEKQRKSYGYPWLEMGKERVWFFIFVLGAFCVHCSISWKVDLETAENISDSPEIFLQLVNPRQSGMINASGESLFDCLIFSFYLSQKC
jgi:hypothetical protein